MGHAHMDVTMDVYNHVSETSRIESEITRLESVELVDTKNKKNWCQNGVKSRKVMIIRKKSVANPVKIKVCKKSQKN